MSLLLDALKRAEQEKAARGGDAPAPGPASAAPAPAPSPRAAPSTGAALELQPLHAAGSTPPPPGASRADPHAAQAMFEAKSATRAAQSRNKAPLFAALGAIAVIVLAAGAYVWFSIQSLTPRSPTAAGALRPPPAPTPPPASASASPPPVASAPVASAPASTLTIVPSPGAAAANSASQPAQAAAASRAPAPAAVAEAPERPVPPLQIERTVERPSVPANVSRGYDALRRGDLDAARSGYAAAIAADAGNVDALLGLATVEARSGKVTAAAGHYRRALELDPRNATALAGLAALSDFSRPEDLENRLRADIAKHPASAPLHLALGNLYASQSRWTEAQSAYFEAYRIDPSSADVLYNLAVSLDHLGQARLAGEYYRRSLEAARGQTPQFDPERVSRRLAELRP